MKALTLWQPYAEAIKLGLKKFETRHWRTNYRGLLAIHSSVRPLSRECRELAEKYGIADMSFGEIVAVCRLEDCILMTGDFIKSQDGTEIDFGDWRAGRYAWRLSDMKVLKKPCKIPGHQGLWNFDF
ncbi:MAG: ASCH domain-containing protein [Rickettsiales bacterium]|nr:ASCH domain-containing protein [Rickettsiales bacterium]